MKLSDYRIIPSQLKYKSAPSVDQDIVLSFDNTSKLITEYDRTTTISLAQVYDDERQLSTLFRPTFEISYIYSNSYFGTTSYVPFKNNLFYVLPEVSFFNGYWSGYPQFYEFDFYRPDVNDQHITYESKSAYTYNWTYYLTYAYNNNYKRILSHNLNGSSLSWQAQKGIAFRIRPIQINGNDLYSFECVAPHGLSVGESVELSINYNGNSVFEVYSLGNDKLDSEKNIFNIYNVGYTGNTFFNGQKGTFKRIANSQNITESTSKYYVREHKVLTNVDDLIITKTGFELNAFPEKSQFILSSITPDYRTKISKKDSSNTYTITSKINLDFANLLDNQMRPITEIYLTIINKGYSGYFNKPNNNIGIKEGWYFNITDDLTNNPWWVDGNIRSNSNIVVSSYTLTDISGNTNTFYYNTDLKVGDTISGEFCEWNDYEQKERVISTYYHKIKYNQNVFQIEPVPSDNSRGYYYQPHHPMVLKVFSDYIESENKENVDLVPTYSFYSNSDQEFRWRDLYLYGFVDELGRGVDYPYLNNAHYPFQNVIFRLIPEGDNGNNYITGHDIPTKPLIDGCE